jgi:hypothetical protein
LGEFRVNLNKLRPSKIPSRDNAKRAFVTRKFVGVTELRPLIIVVLCLALAGCAPVPEPSAPPILGTPDSVMDALMSAIGGLDALFYFPGQFTDEFAKRFPEAELGESAAFHELERRDYAFWRKNVSVVFIARGHAYTFLIYERGYGEDWNLSGLVIRSERDKPRYDVRSGDYGEACWLVVEGELAHGSGVSVDGEIWYNVDGSQALQYESGGYSTIFASGGGETPIWADMDIQSRSSLGNSPDGVSVVVTYWTDFNLDYRPVLRGADRAVYRYDPSARRFVFVEDDSTVPAPSVMESWKGEVWRTITSKYSPANHGITQDEMEKVDSPERWIQILERMGATPYPIEN